MAKESDDAMKGLAVPIDSVKTDRLKVTATAAATNATTAATTQNNSSSSNNSNKTTTVPTIVQ